MTKQTATTKTITKAPEVTQAARLERTDLNATSFVVPPASEITKNISVDNLKETAETFNGAKIKAQFGTGDHLKGVLGTRGSTGDPLESIINPEGQQGNGSTFNGSRIKARFGSGNEVTDTTRSGGSTGGLIAELMTPGFDEGRANGGHTSADPKDQPGTGWFGYSQNEKESMGAAGAGLTAVSGATTILSSVGLAVFGVATAPASVPIGFGIAIGTGLLAGAAFVLEKKELPIPTQSPEVLLASPSPARESASIQSPEWDPQRPRR